MREAYCHVGTEMKNFIVLEGEQQSGVTTSEENLIEIKEMLKQRIKEHKPGCDHQWLGE